MILKMIRVFVLKEQATNCYIIEDEISKETLVIDPGGEVNKITDVLNSLSAKLKYIFLTHCHADHAYGVNALRLQNDATVLIHRADYESINKDSVNLSTYIGLNEMHINNIMRVDEHDIIHVGDIELEVIHTPGHTKGSSSLYCKEKKMVFTGDAMFRGTWGRTDLPTGNMEEIMDSIMEKLLKLPDDTIVYPGHGKSTMIREERPIYEDLSPRID